MSIQKNITSGFSLVAIFFLPLLTYAAAPGDFRELMLIFVDIINWLIYLGFTLLFLVFLWGIVRTWIIGGGDPQSIEAGKKIFFAGLIGLVVTLGLWGIVAVLRYSFFGI